MGGDKSPRRLLYLGGHPLVRDALRACLARHGVQLVPAVSVQDALGTLGEVDGAILDDEGLGDASTLESLGMLLRAAPQLKVGVLSASRSPVLPADAIRAGAAAFLSKEAPLAELRTSLEHMLHGHLVVDPLVTRPLLGFLGAEPADGGNGGPYLTPVERQVLRLAADGKANKQIAMNLGLSPLTVKNHLARIRQRLGAADKAQAVAVALRAGLLD